MLAGVAIIAPPVITQQYISSATGKLTALHYISEINKKEPTKYYTINDFFVDRQLKGVNYTSRVTGKYNSSLDLYIYIACPIYSPDEIDEPTKIGSIAPPIVDKSKGSATLNNRVALDTVTSAIKSLQERNSKQQQAQVQLPDDPPEIMEIPAPKAWLCMKYYKQISNRLSEEQKREEYHSFYRASMNAFNQKQLRSFIYLNRVGNNKTRDGYNEAVKKVIFLHNVKDPIILEGIYEPYENRNGNKLMWILITFLGGAVTWLMIVLFRSFKDGQPTAYLQKL